MMAELALTWVLWSRTTVFNVMQPTPRWVVLDHRPSWSACMRLAAEKAETTRLRDSDRRAEFATYRATVRHEPHGASVSVHTQTVRERDAFDRADAEMKKIGGGVLGGTGLGSGFAIDYECWPADVNLNKVER